MITGCDSFGGRFSRERGCVSASIVEGSRATAESRRTPVKERTGWTTMVWNDRYSTAADCPAWPVGSARGLFFVSAERGELGFVPIGPPTQFDLT
jgi:hypothetical protein